MEGGLYLIEQVTRREADVQVTNPDGSRGVIPGGTYVEWHVLLADGSRRLVGACHSEQSAKDLKWSLEQDADDFAQYGDWLQNPAND